MTARITDDALPKRSVRVSDKLWETTKAKARSEHLTVSQSRYAKVSPNTSATTPKVRMPDVFCDKCQQYAPTKWDAKTRTGNGGVTKPLTANRAATATKTAHGKMKMATMKNVNAFLVSDAFYDDGTGLCFWCPKPAVDQWFGVPLCDDHYGQETHEFMQDIANSADRIINRRRR